MVKSLPKNVQDLFNDRAAVKVLSTHSPSSMHAVPLGSLVAITPDLIVFGRGIYNKETHENLQKAKANSELVSALAVKGGTAYQVRVKPMDYQTSGPILDKIREALKPIFDQMKLNVNDLIIGVWTFQPVEIIDQGMGPNAGKKL